MIKKTEKYESHRGIINKTRNEILDKKKGEKFSISNSFFVVFS